MGSLFYQWILGSLDQVIHDVMLQGITNVIGAIGPVVVTLFGICVVLWGFAHLTNAIEQPVLDVAKKLIFIAVIIGLSLNVGRYTSYVVNFVTETPPALAAVATGGGNNVATTAQLLDQMVTKGWKLGDRARQKAGIVNGDFGMYIVAFIFYLGTAALTLFACVLLLLAKFGMAVLLIIGPIFLVLLMFETTKGFFRLWLGQLINFMLTYVLTAIAISLIMGFCDHFLDRTLASGYVDSFAASAQMFIICGIGILILRQVPSIASAISGGIGVSTLGAVGGAARFGGRPFASGGRYATGAINKYGAKAGRWAGRKSLGGAKAGYSRASSMFRRKNKISAS